MKKLRCSRCKKPRKVSDFYVCSGKRRSRCKVCTKKVQKELSKKYYQKNKAKFRARSKKYIEETYAFVVSFKEAQGCKDCGIKYPHWILEFDHLDSNAKEIDVSTAIRNGWSVTRLMTEIVKCEVVCANCHRTRTWRRLRESNPRT